jgi:DNA-binding GntR family transcriptional regulator
VDVLRSAITDARLPPGTRLRVADTARALGISPMPIRDAFCQLESERLITRIPHRGIWVSHLGPEDIVELYDVRALLEPQAARLGIDALTKQTAAALPRLLRRVEAAAEDGDAGRLLTSDQDLLAAVYVCAGNRELLRLITGLWQRLRPYKRLYLSGQTPDGPPFVFIDQERRFVDAALAGDGARAAQIVSSTLVRARDALVAYVCSAASEAKWS